jgi:hypothetical protein
MLIRKSLLKEYIIHLLKEAHKEPNPDISVISDTTFIQPIIQYISTKIAPTIFDEILKNMWSSQIDSYMDPSLSNRYPFDCKNSIEHNKNIILKTQQLDEIFIKNEILSNTNRNFIENLKLVDSAEEILQDLKNRLLNAQTVKEKEYFKNEISSFNIDDYNLIAKDFIVCQVLFYVDEISLCDNKVDMGMDKDTAGTYSFEGFDMNNGQIQGKSYLAINLRSILNKLFKDYLIIMKDNNDLNQWINFINENQHYLITLKRTIRHELEHFYQTINLAILKLKKLYNNLISNNADLDEIFDNVDEFLLNYDKDSNAFDTDSSTYLFPKSKIDDLRNVEYNEYSHDFKLFKNYKPLGVGLGGLGNNTNYLDSRNYLYHDFEIIPQLNDLAYEYVDAAKLLFVDYTAAVQWLFKFLSSKDFVFIREMDASERKSKEIQKYVLKSLQAKDIIFDNPFKTNEQLGFIKSNLKVEVFSVIEKFADMLMYIVQLQDPKYIELFNNEYLSGSRARSILRIPKDNRDITRDEWVKKLKEFSTEIKMQLYKKIQKVWNIE